MEALTLTKLSNMRRCQKWIFGCIIRKFNYRLASSNHNPLNPRAHRLPSFPPNTPTYWQVGKIQVPSACAESALITVSSVSTWKENEQERELPMKKKKQKRASDALYRQRQRFSRCHPKQALCVCVSVHVHACLYTFKAQSDVNRIRGSRSWWLCRLCMRIQWP